MVYYFYRREHSFYCVEVNSVAVYTYFIKKCIKIKFAFNFYNANPNFEISLTVNLAYLDTLQILDTSENETYFAIT